MRPLKILVVLLFVVSLVASITAGAVSADRHMSAQYGGNIYNAGTVNMSNGSIYGGVAEEGGNIYNSGKLSVSGLAKIYDGLSRLFGDNVANVMGSLFSNTGSIFFTDKEGSGVFTDNAGECICGGLNGHLAGCNGEPQAWTKWTDANALPVESGYYKLTGNVNIAAYMNANKSADIYLDLNGHTVSLADGGTRIYHVATNDTNVNITILDSVGTGKIDLGSGTGSFGLLAALHDAGTGSKSLTIYGGIIDGSKRGNTANSGGVIRSLSNATVNIHGGMILSAKINSSDGGAIYSENVLNMTGGTITGGTAVNGGNIAIASGEFNMTGGKILDGYASGYGDNVYVDKANGATMTVAISDDSTIAIADSSNNGIYPSVNIACDCRSTTNAHENGCNGVRYCTGFNFGIPTDDPSVADLDYITVSNMDSKFITGTVGNYTMISALAPQFEIGGITHPDQNSGQYYRLDYANKSAYSSNNSSLAEKMAGVTVRFATDASSFRLYIKLKNAPTSFSNHLNGRFIYGVDVYSGSGTNRDYVGEGGQLMANSTEIAEVITLPGGYKEVVVNLPIYSGVEKVEIGLPGAGKIAAPAPRAYKDIVFYGSSITQGLSAVRPGTSYVSMLGQALNANVRNLGFASGAMGEQSVAQYIASLENISAIVLDYDHNAPSLDHLASTHYDFYKTVRDAHPNTPIIMMSRPIFTKEVKDSLQDRVDVIMDTYNRAVAAGDQNIYFINGDHYFPDDYPDLYTDDMTHPNTLGMYNMAKTVYPVLKAVLDGEKVPEVKEPTTFDFGTPTSDTADLSKLDYVKVSTLSTSKENGYNMVSVLGPQFAIGGCEHPNDNDGRFYRLDRFNTTAYSQANRSLAANTAGINVRFCTDATKIYIDMESYNVKLPLSAHMSGQGTWGIDVYVGTGTDKVLYKIASSSDTKPQRTGTDGLTTIPITTEITLPTGYKEVQINLPLYAGARNISVGFPDGASVAYPTERAYGDVVVYGPSIAQGCAASRPGLAYSNLLSLALNANVRNLGFSGSALGEQAIAEYIADIDNISAFIMDYDHNNTTSGLQNTHYAFYKTVREAHPDIPIIILSRPVYKDEPTNDHHIRISIIRDTYERALAEGDQNVYFISGDEFFDDDYADWNTVDSVHPDDLGMYYTAKTIYPLLKKVLDAK